MFNNHLSRIGNIDVDILKLIQQESEFQKDIDSLLGLNFEESKEEQKESGMWSKFKTFVKKEIDEFKQTQEDKKILSKLKISKTQAKIRFIKLLEL